MSLFSLEPSLVVLAVAGQTRALATLHRALRAFSYHDGLLLTSCDLSLSQMLPEIRMDLFGPNEVCRLPFSLY